MINPNVARLKKLAECLENLKIGLRVDFLEDHTLNDEDPIRVIPVFITAIRCFPEIFKNDWRKNDEGEYICRNDTLNSTYTSIIKYFNVDATLLSHLLSPYMQQERYGGKILRKNSSPKDIAYNIKELIKISNLQMKLHPDIDIFISKN